MKLFKKCQATSVTFQFYNLPDNNLISQILYIQNTLHSTNLPNLALHSQFSHEIKYSCAMSPYLLINFTYLGSYAIQMNMILIEQFKIFIQRHLMSFKVFK